MQLNGKHDKRLLRIDPFDPQNDSLTYYSFFTNSKYKYMWRHLPKLLLPQDMAKIPAYMQAEFFTIHYDNEACGVLFFQTDSRLNRGFYLGIVLSDDFQSKGLSAAVFALFLDYAYNYLGLRKCIIEVLSEDTNLKQTISKAGFLHEGKMLQNAYFDGQYHDEERYVMFDSYFNKKYKDYVKSLVV